MLAVCAVAILANLDDAFDIVLYPISLHSKMSNQVERIVILSHDYIIPSWVLKQGLARSFLLVVLAGLSLCIQQVALAFAQR